MRKEKLFLLILICISTNLISLEFNVNDFSENPNDLIGLVYSVKDINTENCAVIRIETDALNEIFISDIEVYKREKKARGVYYFYISHRERRFSILSKGYMPFDFEIPIAKLESAKVYLLKLSTSGFEKTIIDSRIRLECYLNESPDNIYIDEEKVIVSPMPLANKFLIILEFERGEHTVNFKKKTYRDIYISKMYDKNEIINEDFVKEIGTISINSNPKGINVYLDDTFIGETPTREIYKKPGEYKIYFEYKDLEIPVISNISDGENKLNYDLIKDFISCVNIETNYNTQIIFNQMSSEKNLFTEILPGNYPLKIYFHNYKIIEETIDFTPGYNKIKLNLNDHFDASNFDKYCTKFDVWQQESKISLYASGMYLLLSGLFYYQANEYYNDYIEANNVHEVLHYKKKYNQFIDFYYITCGVNCLVIFDLIYSNISKLYYKSKIKKTLKNIKPITNLE